MTLSSTSPPRILIYLLRRDLRLVDNPVFHELSNPAKLENSIEPGRRLPHPEYTHLLPIYALSPDQIEVSGLLSPGDGDTSVPSPYPEARSRVGRFWRCGTHRAKFLAQSVWDLKSSLEKRGSGLEIRVGPIAEVLRKVVEWYAPQSISPGGRKDSIVGEMGGVVGVWMTSEEGTEERQQEDAVKRVAEDHGIEFRLCEDEKYFIDEYVEELLYTVILTGL
jgi:deoxyribodipyrimidine photo-lyase